MLAYWHHNHATVILLDFFWALSMSYDIYAPFS
jgi:hypothetical protein